MALKLTDVEYMSGFFENQEEKLNYFKVNVLSAIHRTIQESNEIIQELSALARNGLANQQSDLDTLFEPLHKNEAFGHPMYHTDYKAKGFQNEAPWITIYAVRCNKNFFVITGFEIKLVRQMKDDPLLVIELQKLEKATAYLKEEGFLD
jgi:hypothetical protein